MRRAAINESEGARTIYLLGYNEGLHFVEAIAKECQARGLVESYETELYDAIVRDDVRRHRITRLIAKPGEGSRFLDEHPDTSEWPSIEDDIEWQEILARVKAGGGASSILPEPPDQDDMHSEQSNP